VGAREALMTRLRVVRPHGRAPARRQAREPRPILLTEAVASRAGRRATLRRRRFALLLIAAAIVALAWWLSGGRDNGPRAAQRSDSVARTAPPTPIAAQGSVPERRPRPAPKPRLPVSANVYAATGAGKLVAATRKVPPRIYVPNSDNDTVDVVDPASLKIVEHFHVGALPQHITPSYDLKTLYVDNDNGNSLTPIDPRTAKPKGAPIPVDDPYNLYFTPDGHSAIVVAERKQRLDFRNPRTWHLQSSLAVRCGGVDHLDFSADGRYLIASCEFSSQLLKIDLRRRRVIGTLPIRRGRGSPQDVKLSPDGKLFYVADQYADGVWLIDGRRFRVVGFLPTGEGAHGLYPSRNAKQLYATNRGDGTISVISFARRKVITTWRIAGGSPDMGGVSADGKTLWLSGRYNGEIYALSTRTGRLLARIKVGGGPHGIAVWPQPGRFSLGHTGVLR
jgi:DNA-binding beta-propeller fold protein YncE